MSMPRSSCSSNAKSQNSDDSESGAVETGAAVEQSQLLLSTGSTSSQDSSGSSQTSTSDHKIVSPAVTVSLKKTRRDW